LLLLLLQLLLLLSAAGLQPAGMQKQLLHCLVQDVSKFDKRQDLNHSFMYGAIRRAGNRKI
jgi:hypothetical protein